MATKSITSLGLGNADLTAVGKLSETGLSQVEIADAVVEGDKLKKGNIPAGQVGAYTKAEVDGIIDNIPTTDLSDYYNKAQVDSLISAIPETDLTNYYNKTEVYNKLESYSKAEVDGLIAGGGADLSDYYTKAQVDSLIDAIPETDLSNYYNKTEVYNKLESYSKAEVDNLIPDISTKQDTLVSATNIKTINGQSVLGNGDIETATKADLMDYYTKPQVDGFINEINAELDSLILLGEYGVRWNQESDIYMVLGSVNRTQIQRNMKRCVLNNNGTVNYYLNLTNSNFKEDGVASVLTGADGNVMVEVPKFWYKHSLNGDVHEWWVSDKPLAGYSVHPWFLEGGVERPFRYYRAYTPTVVGGKLRSISGSTPTRNQTRATFRTQARANGAGWELCSWNALNAIQLLFLTEYCTFNSQAVLGRGNDTGSDFGITTGQSNGIGNASSGATNNDTWMSYRGIENWYADCWEFIDGINVKDNKVYLNQNPATFADDVFTGDYVDSEVTVPIATNSFIQKISGNFIPTAVGGSSSTYVTDAYWSGAGNRVICFGGDALYGLTGGGFPLSIYPSEGGTLASLGAGLSR